MAGLSDYAWAAGLFEGEGCFSTTGAIGKNGRRKARAALAMTDEDVVRRFRETLGFGALNWRKPSGSQRQPQLVWSASNFEHFQATVAMLWPWLGERRRARATELMVAARQPTWQQNQTHCANGHEWTDENIYRSPSRPHVRNCRTCRTAAFARYVSKKKEKVLWPG